MSANHESTETTEQVQDTGIDGGDPFHQLETDLMRLEARMRQLADQHPEAADRGGFGPKKSFEGMEDCFGAITNELSNASTVYREQAIDAEADDGGDDDDGDDDEAEVESIAGRLGLKVKWDVDHVYGTIFGLIKGGRGPLVRTFGGWAEMWDWDSLWGIHPDGTYTRVHAPEGFGDPIPYERDDSPVVAVGEAVAT